MNLRDKNHKYKCIECGRETRTLHEIMHGTANKRVSVNYCFQVPLCGFIDGGDCHETYMYKLDKIDRVLKQVKWIEYLGLDYDLVRHKFNNYKDNIVWFKSVRQNNLDRVMSLII